ncbi:MAG: ATP-dependent zinc protease [Magnetococcales bacterium]|nr:ATP-dependent zinc protease [Magnetococcales bacterium]
MRKHPSLSHSLPVIGWREWVSLPDLGVNRIKTKIDTGARTSALHALEPKRIQHNGQQLVRFHLHPAQRKSKPEIICQAPLVDCRTVVNSGGQTEYRLVILSRIILAEQEQFIEITLTNRAPMGFRMLIGRTAIGKRFLVDPGRSFLVSKHLEKEP